MKVLAVVFTIIGLVGTITGCSSWLIAPGISANNVIYISLGSILTVVSIIISIAMLVSLTKNRKSILLGILGIFFSGLLSGIFYLIWSPHR